MADRTAAHRAVLDTVLPLVDLATVAGSDGAPPVLIDGGANDGNFSAAFIEARPDARIAAYEPDPDSAVIARRRFGDRADFELVEAALAGSGGQAVLHRGLRPATHSLLPRPSGSARAYFPKEAALPDRYTVRTVTLDDEIHRLALPRVSLLKLDLQGGEQAALEGARESLAEQVFDVILTEVAFVPKYEEQPLFPEIAGTMTAAGYSFYGMVGLKVGPYTVEPASPRRGQWNQADAIYLSREVRRALDG